MAKKHWIQSEILRQASTEDPETAIFMRNVANSLAKCSSRTIFDMAWKNYRRLCKKDHKEGLDSSNRSTPKVSEYVDWKGDEESDSLTVLGLAKCKRIQCPICCMSRSLLRRRNALEWAKEISWNEFYAVSITFTVSHTLSDSDTPKKFLKVLDALTDSLKSFSSYFRSISKSSGRGYKSPNPESLGYISSLECTYGENGLHPHFHTILFTKSIQDVERFREWFRKDRARLWRKSGKSLLRMPDFNEEKSFQILVSPNEKSGPEKIISYVNKGLFETISVVDKDRTWSKSSKNIFQISSDEMKYFCVFFEATRGKRFYRSGGICRQIKGISQQIKDFEEGTKSDVLARKMKTLIRIETEKKNIPQGWISEFVIEKQDQLEKKAIEIESEKIRDLVQNEWINFLKSKIENIQHDTLLVHQSLA